MAKREKKQRVKALKVAKPVREKKVSGNKKTLKIPDFLNTIHMKFNLLLIVSIIVSVTVTTLVTVNYSKDLVVDSAYGKMLNVVSSYGAIVDKEENGKKLTSEEYEALLNDVSLDGVASSNCFLVSKDGIVMYHSDPDMIGKPNKVDPIKKVTAGITKGIIPESLCTEYDENGVTKYASYYITQAKSIIVMCADGKELMSPISSLLTRAIGIGVIMLVIAVIICAILVGRISKPLGEITKVINDSAALKLRLPANIDKLCARGDETGKISRAVKKMCENLQDVVGKIDDASVNIEQNMSRVEESSNSICLFCTDNSDTADRLAGNTKQVSEMASGISSYMDDIKMKSEDIKANTEENSKVSDEISVRADNMQVTTREAIERTRNVYESIVEKTDAAINGLQSVSKINELTETISDISDQTSLLSLNASIEAARAGEAGRGFSVVATEISNLAKRSKDTVGDIGLIVEEVNGAVRNIQDTIEGTMKFLETNVLKDYDDFSQIGEQYRQDADTFKSSMMIISEKVDELDDSIQQVAENLSDIQNTISTTADGVNDVAEKTNNVVSVAEDNHTLTGDTTRRVDELKQIVQMFDI